MRRKPPVPLPLPDEAPLQATGVLVGRAPRLLYLDSLRGILMLLGIVLHASARFGEHREALGGGWVGWTYVGQFIHLWRMPAFFLIAGFFATLVLSRRDVGAWWRRRIVRLGLPLVFGLLVVNAFLWPAKAWVAGELTELDLSYVLNEVVAERVGRLVHLWFLVHLLVYCSVLAVMAWAVRRWRRRPHLRAVVARQLARPWLVLAAVALVSVACGWALAQGSAIPLGWEGVRLKSSVAPYVASFGIGAVLGLAPQALPQVIDDLALWMLPPALVLPLLLFGPLAFFEEPSTASGTVAVLAGLAWSVLLISFFKAHVDRGGWGTRYLVDASLPVYLVHLPVLFAVAGVVASRGVGPVVGGLATIAITAVVSFAIYEVLNLSRWTRWLSTGRGERGTSVRDLRGPALHR